MAAANLLDVQREVFRLVTDAVAAIGAPEVYDHTPHHPPNEFVRIDGFSMTDTSMKNCLHGRHSFQVIAFDRPVDDMAVGIGQKRVKEIIEAVCGQFAFQRFMNRMFNLEYVSVERDDDGVTQAATARFTITL